jgi:hypothetical protein
VTNWLEQLQPGDQVIVQWQNPEFSYYETHQVVHVDSARVFTDEVNYGFSRSDGLPESGLKTLKLVEATAENLTEARRQRVAERLSTLGYNAWNELGIDKLERITAIIDEN